MPNDVRYGVIGSMHFTRLIFTSLVLSLAIQAAPFRKVLTDSTKGYRVGSWQMVASDLPGYKGQAKWHIRKRILQGGKQEGVELIEVDNGKLRFRVIPTRGMGILDVNLGDVRLGWDSPIKEVVHPKFINLESRRGLGWIEGFNEWMARCGLEYAGHPGKDTFITNTGDTGEMDLTLHGKISNIPASEVIVTVDRKAPYTIRVRGRVDERVFFGPKLELWTEISTVPGSNTFTISDTLTNRGSEAQEFMLIYHANYGSPLLEKGAKLVTAAKRVTPFNDHAGKTVNQWDTYGAPKSGFVEEVYQVFPYADKSGRTTIQLQNAKGDRGVSMNWSLEQLPYLTQWKNTVAKTDGYVTGLEPGTSFPHNRKWERAKGRVSKLEPGRSRSFSITFGIQDTKTEVEAVAQEIIALRANRETKVDEKPEADPFPKSE
ncbi:MAG: aldose 1-epimerase family protein [Verrucomicrobiota bacterium]|nr:aldose 1-epimerase family protein [Verrucomicrobiota bacterium]